MAKTPDILGYKLSRALSELDSLSYDVLVKETVASKNEKQGDARVLRLKKMDNNKIEIIISYFN